MDPLKLCFPLKMVVLHCDVSLPKGNGTLKRWSGSKNLPVISKKGGSTHPPKSKGLFFYHFFYEFPEFLRLTHDLGGGFKRLLSRSAIMKAWKHFLFSSLSGEMIQFDFRRFFQMGWLKPPTSWLMTNENMEIQWIHVEPKSTKKSGGDPRVPRCIKHPPFPIGSMYGIYTYIYHTNQPNVGKYTIHGSYGFEKDAYWTWGFSSQSFIPGPWSWCGPNKLKKRGMQFFSLKNVHVFYIYIIYVLCTYIFLIIYEPRSK